jgi:hypothetical protein
MPASIRSPVRADIVALAARVGCTVRRGDPYVLVCTGRIDNPPIQVGFRSSRAIRRWLGRRPEMRRA